MQTICGYVHLDPFSYMTVQVLVECLAYKHWLLSESWKAATDVTEKL